MTALENIKEALATLLAGAALLNANTVHKRFVNPIQESGADFPFANILCDGASYLDPEDISTIRITATWLIEGYVNVAGGDDDKQAQVFALLQEVVDQIQSDETMSGTVQTTEFDEVEFAYGEKVAGFSLSIETTFNEGRTP